jgi:hypothetical protein
LLLTDGPDGSVRTVSGYGLDDRAIEVQSPAQTKGFFLYCTYKPPDGMKVSKGGYRLLSGLEKDKMTATKWNNPGCSVAWVVYSRAAIW